MYTPAWSANAMKDNGARASQDADGAKPRRDDAKTQENGERRGFLANTQENGERRRSPRYHAGEWGEREALANTQENVEEEAFANTQENKRGGNGIRVRVRSGFLHPTCTITRLLSTISTTIDKIQVLRGMSTSSTFSNNGTVLQRCNGGIITAVSRKDIGIGVPKQRRRMGKRGEKGGERGKFASARSVLLLSLLLTTIRLANVDIS